MIEVLSDIVQNKIAAGEVIERPASAVKELVENAIDAGATRIYVEVEEGGMRVIKVGDDGCGMNKTDLLLSVKRHATSKIHDVEDIFSISTMGFRGEALPSIASVARLSISTCIAGSEVGQMLRIVGGKVEGVQPAPPRVGTLVEVGDLFFNTPARRKFMKSAAAEMGAINETITRIALANPEIAFSIKGNGKKSMELPVHADLVERIHALFGRDLKLLPVEYMTSNGALRITGYCGKPPDSRGTGKSIYTMLNKRWIRHQGISRGIVDAYQGTLPPRRYPFAVLNLSIDPKEVDVNAHPTKEVVRFENNSLFVGGCRKAVEKAVRSGEFAEKVIITAGNNPDRRQHIGSNVRDSVAGYLDSVKSGAGRLGSIESVYKTVEKGGVVESSSEDVNNGAVGRGGYSRSSLNNTNFAEKTTAGNIVGVNDYTGVNTVQQRSLDIDDKRQMRFVGQVGEKYLIVEKGDGVVFIDQHALHERWNYERLMSKERAVDSQRLLIPIEIKLSALEMTVVSGCISVLEGAGFELKLSEEALIVTAHPDIIRPHNIERVVRDVLADVDAAPVEEYRERINASLACRSAVLFGMNLNEELCLELLSKLESGALATCPHGRPTRITFTWKELANKFGR